MKRIGFIFFIVLLGFSTAYAQDFSAQDQKQIFLEGVVTAVGTSAPGQKRYQAIKAAELDAQSKLVGKTQGIHISNSTTSELNKLVKDTIERRIQGTLHGVRSCGEKFYSDGHAEVCQQIDLRGKGGIYDAAYPVIREYMPKAEPFRAEHAVLTKTEPADKTPSPQPKPYDGLIVDARKLSDFQPALANRILDAKGRVIYEPSMVSQQLLIDLGPAQFAADEAKAKAILENTGSKHPLMIRTEHLKSRTDVVVSDKDARDIFESNQKTNMLASARVVFLLK